jgi:hypothetical protein
MLSTQCTVLTPHTKRERNKRDELHEGTTLTTRRKFIMAEVPTFKLLAEKNKQIHIGTNGFGRAEVYKGKLN